MSNICMVPSLYESFSYAVLEAMACGKAVIASNVGGIPEIIRDGVDGVLFPVGDYRALADRLIYLLSNSSYTRSLGQAARLKSLDYSIENITLRTLELYYEVLNQ